MNNKCFRIIQRRLLLPHVISLPVLIFVLLIITTGRCNVGCIVSDTGRWIDPSIVVIVVVNGLQSEIILPSITTKPRHYGNNNRFHTPQQQQQQKQYPTYRRYNDHHPIQQRRQQQQQPLRLSRFNSRHSPTRSVMMMSVLSNKRSTFQSLSTTSSLLRKLRGGTIGTINCGIGNQRISISNMTNDGSNNIKDISTNNHTSIDVSSSSSSSQQLIHEMIAEMTGTFLIVQIGSGAIMTSLFVSTNVFSLYAMAMIWTITITIAIYCTRNISGAHLNPAISIAIALIRPTRQFNSSNKLIPYIIAQYMGAILASITNLVLYGKHIVQYELLNHIVRSSRNAIPSAKAFGEYYFDPVTTFHAFFGRNVWYIYFIQCYI
jgi:hypothetical protein